LAALDDGDTRVCAVAERAFLARLGASCNSPLAAHARVIGGGGRTLHLNALIASEDGRDVMRAHAEGGRERASALGGELAAAMLARGAATVADLRSVSGGTA
jgi:hydroxymethylbilane synthase